MNDASPVFFSVVIPAYNRKDLVGRTVDSVLRQEYSPFEVIVVDDGSTDGTAAYLREQYRGDQRVRIIVQSNQERGAARNHGLREAKGEYVLFLDSDDQLLPDHLAVLNEAIRRHRPDFLATKFKLLREGRPLPTQLDHLSEGWYDYQLFLNGNALACNVCVRKNNPQLFPFEEDRRYAIKEDWMFHLQNLRHARLYLVDRHTVAMDDHDARSMRSDHRAIVDKTFLALEWILKNVELDETEQRLLRAHAHYFAAIHRYIDRRYTDSRKELMSAVRLVGMQNKYLALYLKTLAGKAVTDRFVRLVRGRKR